MFVLFVLIGAALAPAAFAAPVVFRVGTTSDYDSLNPFVGFKPLSYELWHLNYDSLVTIDPSTMAPAPSLAQSWSTSAGGKTWTFHLRHDVKWQDGKRLTAADVAFTYNQIIKRRLSSFAQYTRGIDHATAVDAYTVRLVCTRPKADMLSVWIPILPKHIWSGKSFLRFRNSPPIVGSGPYQVVAAVKNSYVNLKSSPGYWGGAHSIGTLLFFHFANSDMMVQDLRAGNIDVADDIPAALYDQLTATPGLTTLRGDQLGYDYLSFNCFASSHSKGNPVLRRADFRAALDWAVDRDAIVTQGYGGVARPADSVITSEFFQSPDWHWSPLPGEARGFDIDHCKQLLDAGGYTDTNGDSWREYRGTTIALRLFTRSASPSSQAAGDLIRGWFQQAGVKVRITVMDDGVLSDRIYNFAGDGYAPNFDMFIWSWYTEFDPNFALNLFRTSQIMNWSDCLYSNPQYDQLYAQQNRTLDPVARKTLIDQMQQILYRDSPYLVLTYPVKLQAYDSAHWQGWVRTPSAGGCVVLTPTSQIDSYLSVHPAP